VDEKFLLGRRPSSRPNDPAKAGAESNLEEVKKMYTYDMYKNADNEASKDFIARKMADELQFYKNRCQTLEQNKPDPLKVLEFRKPMHRIKPPNDAS
jgi:hypothetical protein